MAGDIVHHLCLKLEHLRLYKVVWQVIQFIVAITCICEVWMYCMSDDHFSSCRDTFPGHTRIVIIVVILS